MPTAADVLKSLGAPEALELVEPDWAAAQASYPAGDLAFLTAEFLRVACEHVELPQAMSDAVLTCAARVRSDGALRQFAWYCYSRVWEASGKAPVSRWPLLLRALDRDAGLFYVLILLAGTPAMQAAHAARDIPRDVVRATVADLPRCMQTDDYAQRHGEWGISPRIFAWLLTHWRGELYQLGRLQFAPSRFDAAVRVYRHQETQQVLALSEGGVAYRGDGALQGAGGVVDAAGAWTSLEISCEPDAIAGHPVDALGRASAQLVHLPPSHWQVALRRSDAVLEIHIPVGGPMDFDACGESLRSALNFFRRHFPERAFVAFTCVSWFLDPQFESLLPAASNIVRFLQEVYLFPVRGSDAGVIRAAFGVATTDVKTAPRNTTLRRAVAAHLEQGGHFHGGGCFLLCEDLAWGRRPYRGRLA